MKQLTLNQSFKVQGKGLHTGLHINAEFCPAPVNHGYKIQRVDLPDQPVINVLAENVVESNRGTVVAGGGAQVSTIEHAMAALYALGIDNVLIKVDAPEIPILDGSSMPYVEAIEQAGIAEQDDDKDFYVVKRKIEVVDEATGSKIMVLPDDEFSVEVKINFDSPVLQNQYASLEHVADFKRDIANSRTFVFLREIEPLLKANLIKGGDLENAIVIHDAPISQEQLDHMADLLGVPHRKVSQYGYINDFELHASNEPARHKLLDVIGDMALIGRPLKGKVIATKPGHTINAKFAKLIRREIVRQNVQAPLYNPNLTPVMDNVQIREHLPHRYPFLLVDKIIEIGKNYIVGVHNVSTNEPFFQGHFPDEPVMPGVLQIEAMAQTGGLLVLSTVDEPEKYSTYFMKIDNVKFRNKVVPGDTLIFHVSFTTPLRRGCAVMKGYAFVGEKIVTECEFMAQIVKNK